MLRGEAKLGEKKVSITPPDPLGELGSGWEKVAAGMVEQTSGGSKPAKLTIGGR